MGSSVTKAGFAILTFVLIAGMGCSAPNHLDAETVAGKRLALMAAVAPMPYVHHLMLASAHIAPHDPPGTPRKSPPTNSNAPSTCYSLTQPCG